MQSRRVVLSVIVAMFGCCAAALGCATRAGEPDPACPSLRGTRHHTQRTLQAVCADRQPAIRSGYPAGMEVLRKMSKGNGSEGDLRANEKNARSAHAPNIKRSLTPWVLIGAGTDAVHRPPHQCTARHHQESWRFARKVREHASDEQRNPCVFWARVPIPTKYTCSTTTSRMSCSSIK